MRYVRAMAITAALVAAQTANAQGYFGQNQVQYKHFDWRVYETEHFLVHYYTEEKTAALDAARMAERSYARLSQVLGHQFREKKPVILYASRADFGQNNVTGDLGEGVGGVTESGRHRLIMPFTGDYRSFERVLAHELVHEFQYDVFARGKAGANQQNLERINPPLWFMEGMAEYLAIGPNHTLTTNWLRDAAVAGNVPTLAQMTDRPDKFFPYRFGESLWQYVGERWGDAAIGEVLQATPNVGVERAIQRVLGLPVDELSSDWREWVLSRYLSEASGMDRARAYAQPLLTHRLSGGEIFLAPALSNDGKYIAFLSNGEFNRGEVFIDLWLGDAKTGKRIKRLVKSTLDPNFEELRLLYSQSAFSNNGKYLAFTAMREGKDVLYIIEPETQKILRRIDTDLDGMTGPSWSPDDKRIVFSGTKGGITDLFMVDASGKNLKQLTNDRYGDLQPSWSPDGRTVVFATDRSPETSFQTLKFPEWRIAFYDVENGRITEPANQDGLNINPVWSPDGTAVAFISDRTGAPQIFMYELATQAYSQVTNLISGVSAITEYSPAISWARTTDRLAFTYYENGDYSIWSIDNPRSLRRNLSTVRQANATAEASAQKIADTKTAASDTLTAGEKSGLQTSTYRAPAGARRSSDVPSVERSVEGGITNVAQLLANPTFGLPDTTRFKEYKYKVAFRPDYISQPQIGYATGNQYGLSGFQGGTTIVLGDLLSNHQIAVSASVYGQLSDASVLAAYTNLSRRFQYTVGAYQEPVFLPQSSQYETQRLANGGIRYIIPYTRYVLRTGFTTGLYPLNRFTRFETGVQFNNIDRSSVALVQDCYSNGCTGQSLQTVSKEPAYNFFAPQVAFVTDNTLATSTGPISGRRARFQIAPAIGNLKWIDYLGDYRRYFPIRFNSLTFAVRGLFNAAVGRDEGVFPKYIGRPEYVRGYDRANFSGYECTSTIGASAACNTVQLVGSRVAVGNAELRFPLIRRFDLGSLPIGLPPVDGVLFYDAGLAWSKGQSVSLSKPADYNFETMRYPLTSYGFGLRVNLFNIAILRWDYAVPRDIAGRKANWTFSLGPSF